MICHFGEYTVIIAQWFTNTNIEKNIIKYLSLRCIHFFFSTELDHEIIDTII